MAKCLTPIELRNSQAGLYKGQTRYIAVPCGRCVNCLKREQDNWSVRIKEELKNSKSSLWITVTYSDEELPEYYSLSKEDIKKWIKKLRQAIQPTKVRYFIVGEYGSKTDRPHYHCCIFLNTLWEHNTIVTYLENTWAKGQIHLGNIEPESIYYTTKYMLKAERFSYYGERQKPFRLMSKGFGSSYIDRMKDWHINGEMSEDEVRIWYQDGKYKKSLPRYYRDKIFGNYKDLIEKNADNCKRERDRKEEKISLKVNRCGGNTFTNDLENYKYIQEKLRRKNKNNLNEKI